MTDVKALLGELRTSDPKFDEAQAVVDLVRSSGDMLERMRERMGWSQSELAERLGITTGRVSQLESGTLRNAPSLKMMARVAHVCGETVKLVASEEALPYVRSDANANIDLTDIMRELVALREEVQASRSAPVDFTVAAGLRSVEPEEYLKWADDLAVAKSQTPPGETAETNLQRRSHRLRRRLFNLSLRQPSKAEE